MIEIGTDIPTSEQALQLARSHGGSAAVGIHPHEAGRVTDDDWVKLMHLLVQPGVVALGEIGLDYHYPEPEPHVQKRVFKRQIAMAVGLEIPIVVHNREADDDVVAILKKEAGKGLSGVLHCFSSDWEVANEALQLGFFIGIGGIVTFHNAQTLRDVVKRIPIERIILETDAPYLAPHPHRGKRNDSRYIPLIGEAVAAIKNLPVEDVARITTENAQRLFRLNRMDETKK